MVKKLKTHVSEKPVTQNVVDFAHQIWLAGLGAFSKIEEEGGKLFEALVKEGEHFESRTRKLADDTVEEVKGKVEEVRGKVEEVREMAVDTLDKLEEALEDRIATILNRLGVPTSKDIEELASRVEALNESVRELTKMQAGS